MLHFEFGDQDLSNAPERSTGDRWYSQPLGDWPELAGLEVALIDWRTNSGYENEVVWSDEFPSASKFEQNLEKLFWNRQIS
jgi:hypothetical protein